MIIILATKISAKCFGSLGCVGKLCEYGPSTSLDQRTNKKRNKGLDNTQLNPVLKFGILAGSHKIPRLRNLANANFGLVSLRFPDNIWSGFRFCNKLWNWEATVPRWIYTMYKHCLLNNGGKKGMMMMTLMVKMKRKILEIWKWNLIQPAAVRWGRQCLIVLLNAN